MNLSITKNGQNQSPYVTFSISANYQIPISLWISNPFPLKSKTEQSLSEDIMVNFFFNIINGVLSYGPCKKFSFRFPAIQIREEFGDIFNIAFLNLAFLVCIYEAPHDLRSECVDAMRLQLMSSRSREASKLLVRVLGPNIEEHWMRSLNLAITNHIVELQASNYSFRTPSSLFSYAVSANGLWKLQFYCPVIAMHLEDPSSVTQDERLLFSLRYQQLEGVIQLAYKVIYRENWIDVVVGVDNVRYVEHNFLNNQNGYIFDYVYFFSLADLHVSVIQ